MDELNTTSAPTPTTPADGLSEINALIKESTTEQDSTDVEQPEQVDDSEEVDYEGKKYKVPAPIKKAVMLHSDYTRKTQEAADTKRKAEAAEVTYNRLANMHEEAVQARGYVASIDAQLEQIKSTDWDQLSRNDPGQAQRLMVHQQQLRDARNQVVGSIEKYEKAAEQQRNSDQASRMSRAMDMLKKNIKDFSHEYDIKLSQYAERNLDIGPDQLASITDPVARASLVIAVHKAYVGDQAIKKALASAPATEPTPAATVRANTQLKKPLAKMTTEEFIATRNAEERAKRARPQRKT